MTPPPETKQELKPCPFGCERHKLRIINQYDQMVYVVCEECHATGPLAVKAKDNKAAAITQWNTRHDSAEVQRLREALSEVVRHLGSGAVSPKCSVEFLCQIPNEVALCVGTLRRDSERLRRIEAAARDVLASRQSVYPAAIDYLVSKPSTNCLQDALEGKP